MNGDLTLSMALANTAMGMGTVFIILTIIAITIYSLKYINMFERKENKDTSKKEIEQNDAEQNCNISNEVICSVVMAAIKGYKEAVDTKEVFEEDSFVVRSIRRR